MERRIDDPSFSVEIRRLFDRAIDAAKHAYAPYSRFRVGAALLGADGVYCGANVENASLGLTLCAERAALAAAVVQSDPKIQSLAIACIDAPHGAGIEAFMPCGACRQWFAELMPDGEVFVLHLDKVEHFRVSELLPLSFRFSS